TRPGGGRQSPAGWLTRPRFARSRPICAGWPTAAPPSAPRRRCPWHRDEGYLVVSGPDLEVVDAGSRGLRHLEDDRPRHVLGRDELGPGIEQPELHPAPRGEGKHGWIEVRTELGRRVVHLDRHHAHAELRDLGAERP